MMIQNYFKIGVLTVIAIAGAFSMYVWANEDVTVSQMDPNLFQYRLDAVLNDPHLYDYTLLAEVEKAKQATKEEKNLHLQILISGLIAYSEGQYQQAAEILGSVNQVTDIRKLVDVKLSQTGGWDGLMKICQDKSLEPQARNVIEQCPACSGAGWTVCSTCRGIGTVENRETQQKQLCTHCAGLGVLRCSECLGVGIKKVASPEPLEPDKRIKELITIAVYLKNGGVDLFTQADD